MAALKIFLFKYNFGGLTFLSTRETEMKTTKNFFSLKDIQLP